MSDSTSSKARRKVNNSWLTASVPSPQATPNRTIRTESTIQWQTSNSINIRQGELGARQAD